MSSWFILAGSSLYFSLSSAIFGWRSCIRFIDFVALPWIGQRMPRTTKVSRMIASA